MARDPIDPIIHCPPPMLLIHWHLSLGPFCSPLALVVSMLLASFGFQHAETGLSGSKTSRCMRLGEVVVVSRLLLSLAATCLC